MQELTIKQKLTNYYYFVIFNSILAVLISTIYILFDAPVTSHLHIEITSIIDVIYIVSNHISNIVLISFILSIIAIPSIFLKKTARIITQSIFAFSLISLLIIDTGLYRYNHIHLTSIDFSNLIEALEFGIFKFTSHKVIKFIFFLALIVFIFFINKFLDNSNINVKKIGESFILLSIAFLFISQIIYFSCSSEHKQLLLTYNHYLPFHNNNNNIIKNKLIMLTKIGKNNKLNYPTSPLKTSPVNKPPNILIIAMDAWRADCFNKIDSPNLWNLAQKGTIFNNHSSASNHTHAGLFGLFYSIPPSYYHAFLHNQQQPIFINRLRQLNYQLGNFSSDSIFNVFINDKKHYFQKSSITDIDLNITNEWLQWYENHDLSKPWFSFVFYFSAHELYFPDEYTDKHVPSPIGIRYRDMAKLYGKQNYLERYKTSVNYVDSLAKKIITKLEEANDLENTIIIITSDHGHEVNDHNQNTWGSISNFTDCQIKVPMAIIGSCFNNTDLELQSNNLTTHYDIVPTIMQNFLGITSDVSTYSIGDNLLKKQNFKKWSFATMVLKCSEFSSIMEEKLTIRFNNYGDYSFIDNNNKLLFNKTINMKKLNQSLEHMTRFIKK